MTTRLHIPANVTLVLTVASILWLSACFDDGVDDSRSSQDLESKASQSVPTSIADSAPEPTHTPDTSFEPTVGMLATVPIGRMPMQCWAKECKDRDCDPNKRGTQTFFTGSCDAADAHREFYIEAWRWSGDGYWSEEGQVSFSFIYFEKAGQNQMGYIQCDDILVFKSTKEKKRADSLLGGVCNEYLHSYEDASRKISTMSNNWTTLSGLEERMDRDEIQPFLEVLKR